MCFGQLLLLLLLLLLLMVGGKKLFSCFGQLNERRSCQKFEQLVWEYRNQIK